MRSFCSYRSPKYDEEIGKKIAEALEKVGRDGVVTVEEGRGMTIDIEYKDGMEFDKGYASAYFVTNSSQIEAEMENPYILITDKKIKIGRTQGM